MRPDFFTIQYLYQKGVISREDYEWAVRGSERPVCDGLLPLGYKPDSLRLKDEKSLMVVNDQAKEDRHRRRQRAPCKTKNRVSMHKNQWPQSSQRHSEPAVSLNEHPRRPLRIPKVQKPQHFISYFKPVIQFHGRQSPLVASSQPAPGLVPRESTDFLLSYAVKGSPQAPTRVESSEGLTQIRDRILSSDTVNDRVQYRRVPDNGSLNSTAV